MAEAKNLGAPYELVLAGAQTLGQLPVVNFAAGGIATPADAALMMQLGADGVFVGSGIFKSRGPGEAGEGDRQGDDALPTTPKILAEVSAASARRCTASRSPPSRRTRSSPSGGGRTANAPRRLSAGLRMTELTAIRAPQRYGWTSRAERERYAGTRQRRSHTDVAGRRARRSSACAMLLDADSCGVTTIGKLLAASAVERSAVDRSLRRHTRPDLASSRRTDVHSTSVAGQVTPGLRRRAWAAGVTVELAGRRLDLAAGGGCDTWSWRAMMANPSTGSAGEPSDGDAAHTRQLPERTRVTPHVAQHTTRRRSRIDGRVTRHPGYELSQRKRKRVEEFSAG